MKIQIFLMKSLFTIYLVLLNGAYCKVTERIYNELASAAELTSLAYCVRSNEKVIQVKELFENHIRQPINLSNKPYYEIVSVFDSSNGYNGSGTGFVAISHSSKTIALIFRGTINFDDMMTDLTMTQVEYVSLLTGKKSCEGCKVHYGFLESLKNTRKYSIDYIKILKQKFPDYKVLVTGHSLGGAIATLAGVELQLAGYDPLVITVASPKVANNEFATYIDGIFDIQKQDARYRNGTLKSLDSGIWRIAAKGDIVPMTPPGTTYVHVGLNFEIVGFIPLVQTASMVEYCGTSKNNNHHGIEQLFYMMMTTNAFFLHTNYFLPQSGCPQNLLKKLNLSYY